MADQRGELEHRNSAAERYEEWYQARGKLFDSVERKTIAGFLDLRPGEVLWDAGCGSGRFVRAAASIASKVYATDFSPKSIEVLTAACKEQGLLNVRALVADVTAPPPFVELVDKVLSVQVVQHLPTDRDRLAAVEHLRRQVKAGGRAVVVVYNWSAQKRQGLEKEGTIMEGFHYFRFTPDEGESLLRRAGFDRVRVRGSNHFLRMHSLKASPIYDLLTPLAWLDTQLSRWPFSRHSGNFLVCTGFKGR